MQSIDEAAWQAGAGAVDEAHIDIPLLESFGAAARRDPQALAIADPARTLSYRELWNAAVALGHDVADATRPGDRVGVRLPACAEHAVAVLACLVAGRICVLLDTADPPARTAEVIGAAGIGFVLGEANVADAAIRWRSLEELDTAGEMRAAPPSAMPPNAPAFIVPTSGSSGVPKLIVHSQRSQATIIHGNVDLLRMAPADRMAFTGSASNAATIPYLFQSLVSGGAALVCDIRIVGLNGFLDFVQGHRATMLRVFPLMARILAGLPRACQAFARLRLVRLIGEPMFASDLALLRNVLPDEATIMNSYASSESLGFDWTAPPGAYLGGAVLPSGKLRSGAAFVLRDEQGKPCPPGVAGELLIRSRYNALGEWHEGRCLPGRMEAAGQRDGATLYRTGDLAVIGPDGMLTVLGRADRQVKVNGYRIELGEIEEAMRGLPGIEAAAVVARKDAGRTQLVGFFVPDAAGVSVADLRHSLAGRLPSAMLPARLIALDRLPLLPGFKLDIAALLARAARGGA